MLNTYLNKGEELDTSEHWPAYTTYDTLNYYDISDFKSTPEAGILQVLDHAVGKDLSNPKRVLLWVTR